MDMSYSGNPIDDAQSYIHHQYRLQDEPDTVRCDMDNQIYLKEECVFDKEGHCYINKNHVTNYLENFRDEMCSEEYNRFEKELLNQI